MAIEWREHVEDLLLAHPRLSQQSIQAALAYAAESLRSDTIFPLAA